MGINGLFDQIFINLLLDFSFFTHISTLSIAIGCIFISFFFVMNCFGKSPQGPVDPAPILLGAKAMFFAVLIPRIFPVYVNILMAIILLMIGVRSFAIPSIQGETTYSDPDNYFSLTIPKNWAVGSDSKTFDITQTINKNDLVEETNIYNPDYVDYIFIAITKNPTIPPASFNSTLEFNQGTYFNKVYVNSDYSSWDGKEIMASFSHNREYVTIFANSDYAILNRYLKTLHFN